MPSEQFVYKSHYLKCTFLLSHNYNSVIRSVLFVSSGPVSIFQPLGSGVRQEGLRPEPKRNLFPPSQQRRIVLPSAPSPSPECLSGREALRHVTEEMTERKKERKTNIQCPISSNINPQAELVTVTKLIWRKDNSIFHISFNDAYDTRTHVD